LLKDSLYFGLAAPTLEEAVPADIRNLFFEKQKWNWLSNEDKLCDSYREPGLFKVRVALACSV